MNYRHAFHAGNHADILKHMILLLCLQRLAEKPKPFAVLDAHAGIGHYDLTGEAAARSPEWQGGAAKIWDWAGAPPALAPLLAALRAANPDGALTAYPGSPALIAASLRPGDRAMLCELHPEDFATLKARYGRTAGVALHHRNGYEALAALTPFAEGRGLILIDPPYEKPDEHAASLTGVTAALARMRQATILWWRTLKAPSLIDAADRTLAAEGVKLLRADLAVAAQAGERGLTASSMAVINPPFGLRDALEEALPLLAQRLALAPGGYGRMVAFGEL